MLCRKSKPSVRSKWRRLSIRRGCKWSSGSKKKSRNGSKRCQRYQRHSLADNNRRIANVHAHAHTAPPGCATSLFPPPLDCTGERKHRGDDAAAYPTGAQIMLQSECPQSHICVSLIAWLICRSESRRSRKHSAKGAQPSVAAWG